MVYLKKQCPENRLKRRQNKKHTQLPSMQRVKIEKKNPLLKTNIMVITKKFVSEKFLHMPKEEKRKLYKKKKFVDLDEIETWQQQGPQILCKYGKLTRRNLATARAPDPV